jgi:hypothetical protein
MALASAYSRAAGETPVVVVVIAARVVDGRG